MSGGQGRQPPGSGLRGQQLWASGSGPGLVAQGHRQPSPPEPCVEVAGTEREPRDLLGPGPAPGAATRAQPRRRSHHAALRSSPLNRRAEVIFFLLFHF